MPLDAFLDATGADSDEERDTALRRHARQLRAHVDVLAGKAYWRTLPATPEFVVLFVPGESFLSAALEADPSLLEYAADRRVVLATPTTLIALLRTVAYAWTQQTLADKAREIHELGRDLYERLGTMSGHLDRLGRSLAGSVSAYNRAVGSLENRVLVSARRFGDLGVATDDLDSPEAVVDTPRPLTAAELLDAVAEPRPELPDLDDPPGSRHASRYGASRRDERHRGLPCTGEHRRASPQDALGRGSTPGARGRGRSRAGALHRRRARRPHLRLRHGGHRRRLRAAVRRAPRSRSGRATSS